MDRLGGLVVVLAAHRAGDPGLNPGPGKNFSLKLLRQGSLTSLKSQTRDPQLKVTPGGLVLRIFTL